MGRNGSQHSTLESCDHRPRSARWRCAAWQRLRVTSAARLVVLGVQRVPAQGVTRHDVTTRGARATAVCRRVLPGCCATLLSTKRDWHGFVTWPRYCPPLRLRDEFMLPDCYRHAGGWNA